MVVVIGIKCVKRVFHLDFTYASHNILVSSVVESLFPGVICVYLRSFAVISLSLFSVALNHAEVGVDYRAGVIGRR